MSKTIKFKIATSCCTRAKQAAVSNQKRKKVPRTQATRSVVALPPLLRAPDFFNVIPLRSYYYPLCVSRVLCRKSQLQRVSVNFFSLFAILPLKECASSSSSSSSSFVSRFVAKYKEAKIINTTTPPPSRHLAPLSCIYRVCDFIFAKVPSRLQQQQQNQKISPSPFRSD